jgi:hypothetical protein
MARAGLYLFDAPRIRFGRDGRWYVNGGLTTNQRIADLFAANLTREVDGTYAIRIGNERAVVEVEDTAFVVTSAVLTDTHEIEITLNDGTTESLPPETLAVGRENVMYCRVKEGKERARFLRPAYYQLASYITETEPGRFSLCLGDRTYPVAIGHSLRR